MCVARFKGTHVARGRPPVRALLARTSGARKTTLSGGTLGSCVDEERSHLRASTCIAGHRNILNAYGSSRSLPGPRLSQYRLVYFAGVCSSPAPWTLEAAVARRSVVTGFQLILWARHCLDLDVKQMIMT